MAFATRTPLCSRESGVDVTVVSKRLGQASAKTTADSTRTTKTAFVARMPSRTMSRPECYHRSTAAAQLSSARSAARRASSTRDRRSSLTRM